MAHGIPTIAARSSSLPEIGGDASMYFDPRNASELATQLRRVLDDGDLRRDLVAKGLERARQFRWDRAADKTLEVFRRVVH
jgi:glycosyltransferase involved in cell wall biosynthesis